MQTTSKSSGDWREEEEEEEEEAEEEEEEEEAEAAAAEKRDRRRVGGKARSLERDLWVVGIVMLEDDEDINGRTELLGSSSSSTCFVLTHPSTRCIYLLQLLFL
jgi:hypothetical protein